MLILFALTSVNHFVRASSISGNFRFFSRLRFSPTFTQLLNNESSFFNLVDNVLGGTPYFAAHPLTVSKTLLIDNIAKSVISVLITKF